VCSSARVYIEATTDGRIYLIIWCIAYIGTQCSVYTRFEAKADKYKRKIYTYLRLRLFITTRAHSSGDARNNITYTRQPSSRDVSIKWEVFITRRRIRILIRTLAAAAHTGVRVIIIIIIIIENSRGGHDGSDQYFCPSYADATDNFNKGPHMNKAEIFAEHYKCLSTGFRFPNYY